MPRQIATAVQNKFDAGYITEATGLNYPPHALVDTENCIVNFKGNLTRRPGFNYEVGYQLNTVPSTSGQSFTEYYWQNADGVGSINFIVVQVGATIYFYRVGATTAPSAAQEIFTIDLLAYQTAFNPGVAGTPCQYAEGAGYLFIAHPYCDPVYVKYDQPSGTFSVNPIYIQIRDFTGIDDGWPINQRPPSGADSHPSPGGKPWYYHIYNLYNQGWMTPNFSVEIATIGVGSNQSPLWLGYYSTAQRLLYFLYYTGTWPSNADIWWTFKDAGGAFNPLTQVANVQLGNSQAPQGHYILSAFNQDRTGAVLAEMATATNIKNEIPVGLPVVSSGYFRPSTIAFYAGRVFYAGVQTPGFTNQIYFSQIIQHETQIPMCYQQNDPTASDTGVADLLSDDGGVIISPDIGVVYKLYPVLNMLLVFTSKGVWSVTGSTGFGFTATDYSVNKLSSIPMANPWSFIDLDGVPVWWNDDGIYQLTPNMFGTMMPALTEKQVKPITYATIKTFYDQIPNTAKQHCTGTYNRSKNTIYWLYTSFAPADTERYKYDSILAQNTITGAFYKWTLPTTGQYIAGAVTVYGTGTDYVEVPIRENDGGIVTENDGGDVTTQTIEIGAIQQATKFLVVKDNQISFAECYDTSYLDFGTIPYSSFGISSYTLDAQAPALGKGQATYLVFFFNTKGVTNTVDMQVQWNYALTGNQGKISSTQRLITTDVADASYTALRRKIRGRGRAFSVAFYSVDNNPFDVSGWSIENSMNTQA